MNARPRGLTSLLVLASALLGGNRQVFAHPSLDVLEEAAAAGVAAEPGRPEASLRQAHVYQARGEWEAALVALEQAAEHGADPDAVATARGRMLLDAGRPRLAKREFDRVLRRRPDRFAVLFERGRAWGLLGKPERAARDFGRAIAGMARPTPDHVFARRDALLALGRQAEGVQAIDEGIARVGPVASLQLAALELEAGLGRHADALRRLDQLLAESPRHEAWLVRRAELLERSGRSAEARAAYSRALASITGRPVRRRGPRLDALERRVRTALASTGAPGRDTP